MKFILKSIYFIVVCLVSFPLMFLFFGIERFMMERMDGGSGYPIGLNDTYWGNRIYDLLGQLEDFIQELEDIKDDKKN